MDTERKAKKEQGRETGYSKIEKCKSQKNKRIEIKDFETG